jgi:hypothetical protein
MYAVIAAFNSLSCVGDYDALLQERYLPLAPTCAMILMDSAA